MLASSSPFTMPTIGIGEEDVNAMEVAAIIEGKMSAGEVETNKVLE